MVLAKAPSFAQRCADTRGWFLRETLRFNLRNTARKRHPVVFFFSNDRVYGSRKGARSFAQKFADENTRNHKTALNPNQRNTNDSTKKMILATLSNFGMNTL